MTGTADLHKYLFLSCSVVTALVVVAIVGFIIYAAAPVLGHEGLGFILGSTWDYSTHQYGIFPFLIATLLVTAVTITLAVPLGLATAIFLSEWAPSWLDRALSTMIELLVGVPSVVYGLFGFYILRGYFTDFIDPFLKKYLGFIPLFQSGNTTGLSIALAGTVLAIMVLPTIVALTREAMRGVPQELREGSAALGSTKWETIRNLIVPAALPGIVTGVILGIMRAMGETMAVVMVVGNAGGSAPTSVLDIGEPMTAKIILDFGYYVVEPEGRSALFAIGAVLLVVEVGFVIAIHIASNWLNKRMEGRT